MAMKNNDFDIFEILKLLVQQKGRLFGFFIVFFLIIFTYQYLKPAKYSASLVAKSTILKQSEILVKASQIQSLLENKAYGKLADVLAISKEQANSMSYVEVSAVKNTTDLVSIEVESSDADLTASFAQKLNDYIANDVELMARGELEKKLLSYSLDKINQELDSVKFSSNFNGVYVAAQEQNLVELLDKKTRIERDLSFFSLFKVYEGYEIIKRETSLLVQALSSLLFAFVLGCITVLSLHFLKVVKLQIEE